MKALILFTLLLISSFSISNETLLLQDLAGEWKPFRGYGVDSPNTDKMEIREVTISIDSNGEATLTRLFSGNEVETVKSGSVLQVGSLFYWKFPRESDDWYELSLGGWKLKSGKRQIFGYFYLVSPKHGLFNGWPVSLGRVAVNKPLQPSDTAPVE